MKSFFKAAICMVSASACNYAAETPQISDCAKTNSYGADKQQEIDIYVASRPNAPMLLFLHGGAWRTGDKSELESFARTIAEQGITVATANYRTAPDHPFPAQIEDTVSAVKWLERHGRACGGDPRRLLIGGHSAGGHLAALFAIDAQWRSRALEDDDALRGVVTVGGVFQIESVEGGFPRAIVESVFGPDENDWADASPLSLTARDPSWARRQPFLILYGDDDALAPESKRFARALRKEGVRSIEIEMAETDHARTLITLADPNSEANAALHALAGDD